MIRAVQQSGAVNSLTIWSATLTEDVLAMLTTLRFEAFDEARGIQGYTPGVIIKAKNTHMAAQVDEFAGSNMADLAGWDLRMIYSDYY